MIHARPWRQIDPLRAMGGNRLPSPAALDEALSSGSELTKVGSIGTGTVMKNRLWVFSRNELWIIGNDSHGMTQS
jgi:hypothetical protein